jgi:hypothetical protein
MLTAVMKKKEPIHGDQREPAPGQDENEDLLDLTAAAAYSGLPVGALRTLLRDGRLSEVTDWRGLRIRRSDIEKL